MAISFSKIKSKLGLYDFITFGKYKGCRVDSLIVDNYEYLQYLKYEKIVVFDVSALEALQDQLNAKGIQIVDLNAPTTASYITAEYEEEDIPF
jgi:predicted RNA-binding protein with PIN domain